MNPIILAAFIAPLLYAIVNFIDKFLVTKVATSKSAWMFFGFFSFIISLIIFICLTVSGYSVFLPIENIGMLLLTGVFQVSWVYFYYKALEGGDASSVAPLFQFIGFFSYILGVIFLSEILALPKLVALGFILFGGALLSYNPKKKLAFRKEAGYMLIATLIISLGLVFFKKSTIEIESFTTIGISEFFISSLWMYVGMGLTTVIVFFVAPSFRKEFKVMLKSNTRAVWKVYILAEVLNVLATLAVSYASLRIAVVSVTALKAVQGFYVLMIGIIGTKFLPKYIYEDLSGRSLIFKIVAIVLMAGGAILLAVY